MKSLIPHSMEELAAVLCQMEAGDKFLAGGTDYVIQARRGKFDPNRLVYLGDVPELREITLTGEELRIGAMATMVEITAVTQELPEFRAIADAASDVGSPQVRNKATMAGNLCNASPAGDMLPVSWLFDAQVEVLQRDGTISRRPVSELILGPQKNALTYHEAITAICFDRKEWQGFYSAFQKIGSRQCVSISREGLGVAVRMAEDGTVAQARLSVGAVASTPLRIPQAEALLVGAQLTQQTLDGVTAIVSKTIHDNCRPTNRLYKTEAAKGLTADAFARLTARLEM